MPRELIDAELAEIYKKANGEDIGKAQPLTTQRIFRAMRAMLQEKEETYYLGTCITDGILHATVMRKDHNGKVAVLLSEKISVDVLESQDVIVTSQQTGDDTGNKPKSQKELDFILDVSQK